MITQQELMSILDYDPNTGIFRWKIKYSRKVKIGNIAGAKQKRGYIVIRIDEKLYLAHRLAWLYMTGTWPNKNIDHINGIHYDNSWANLRECDQSQNHQNKGLSKNNKSGYIGVCWYNSRNKWAASITTNYKTIHLGYFDDPQTAHQAYLDAKRKYHTFNPVPR